MHSPFEFVVLLVLRPPPTPTLFPYTTLFRSHRVSEPRARGAARGGAPRSRGQRAGDRAGPGARAQGGGARLGRGAAAAPHGSRRAARRAGRSGGVPVRLDPDREPAGPPRSG